MKFEYLEIRPCISTLEANGSDVTSFVSEDEWNTAIAKAQADGEAYVTFWTIYGRHMEGGVFLATAVGDFTEKKDAHAVMNAILAPMAAARDLIDNNVDIESDTGAVVTGPERASAMLADFINQCSNEERI